MNHRAEQMKNEILEELDKLSWLYDSDSRSFEKLSNDMCVVESLDPDLDLRQIQHVHHQVMRI